MISTIITIMASGWVFLAGGGESDWHVIGYRDENGRGTVRYDLKEGDTYIERIVEQIEVDCQRNTVRVVRSRTYLKGQGGWKQSYRNHYRGSHRSKVVQLMCGDSEQ